ncbi:Mitochondrial substrate/solute carrier [Trinorchestia longiramus]|nr:Mitochondrial substrate/solute carrier [Trinorchestia longiramus]
MSQGLEATSVISISDLTSLQPTHPSVPASAGQQLPLHANESCSSAGRSGEAVPSACQNEASVASHQTGILQKHSSSKEKGGSVGVSLIAGALAGAIAKTTIAPIDRTKINFQATNQRYSTIESFRYLRKCYKSEGFFSLWRGNSATMARIAPYAAIQFASHEQWKKVLRVDTTTDVVSYRRFLAGSLAGVTSQFMTYPLDLARARMAITPRDTYRTLTQVFIKIVRSEGFLKLYRGLTPTMLGVIPYAGTSFGMYETLKAHHREKQEALLQQLAPENRSRGDVVAPNPLERMLFGAVAGLFGQTSSYPLDIARRRMQTASLTGNSNAYATIRGTLTTVYREEGIVHGLYKGLSLNWVKGPISVGMSFAVFDYCKNVLERLTNED